MKRKRPNLFMHLHFPKLPKREDRFFHAFGLGNISLFLILVLGITGLLEIYHYTPSLADANRSLQAITYLVPYGILIRGIHYWAGQLLVGTILLNMLRIMLTGSYKPPRRFNWLLGIALLLFVLLINFTGYSLRWDKGVAWVLSAGTNLLKTIPWIGDRVYQFVVGSASVGEQTIIRFYGWHIYGFAIVAGVILVWHIFRVRRDGRISSRQVEKPEPKTIRNELLEKEIIAIFVVSIFLVVLSLIFPPGLGGPADFNNIPENATAPRFFMGVQQLLMSRDALLMGAIISLSLLIVMIVVPFLLDRSNKGAGTWFHKEGRLVQILVFMIFIGILTLTILRMR